MKILYKILPVAICLVSALSCSLDERIESSATPETYYKTAAQCVTGLNGCYIPLKSIYVTNYFFATECATDLINASSGTRYDGFANLSPATPRFGTTLWTYSYLGVMRCNAIIAAIGRATFSEDEKLPLLAEASILRAFYYYTLTCNFGDVPYYTEEVTDANNSRITKLPRTSASSVRDSCINEICLYLEDLEALENVATYSGSNDFRVGAAVGYMLAGKMCMWNGRYGDAIRIFGHLEDIYGTGAGNPEGTLAKYPLSDVRFSQKYTGESIFEIPHIYVDYGLQQVSSLAYVCTPMRSSSSGVKEDEEADEDEEDDTDFYGSVGIPELGPRSRTSNPVRPNSFFYSTLMPYSGKDLRCARYDINGNEVAGSGGYLAWQWSGWRIGEDRDLTPRRALYFYSSSTLLTAKSQPYLGDKFWCFGMEYNLDFNNYKVFRYAGAVLNLAEAYLMIGRNDMAAAYLNQVRVRAGLSGIDPDVIEREDLLEEIQNECARELFGEFNRRHDLVRWGIWYDRCLSYGSSSLKKCVEGYPCRAYYPIPDKEIALSGGSLDNAEYNKYGL